MRVVLTGGGTGGHLMPFEGIIEALRSVFWEQRDVLPEWLDRETIDLSFVGIVDEAARELFAAYDVPTISIQSGKLRRYASFRTLVDVLVRLPVGVLAALWHMWRIMPDVIVSKGGYGSLPVVLAATFYRIPVLLHESDASPGKANTWLLKLASAITVGFPQAQEFFGKWSYKVFVTGTPVRHTIADISKAEAKQAFGVAADRPVLLVMGGSQGAKQLNEIVLRSLPELLPNMAIIHLTGKEHFETVSAVAEEYLANASYKKEYQAFPYLSDKMPQALVAADAIVSRAGASSLAEIARLRTPALLIPYPHAAADHQRKNAQVFGERGGAFVLDPSNLGKNLFVRNIVRLMENKEVRLTLAKNLEALDFPNAAADIAKLVLELAKGLGPVKPRK